MSPTNIFDLPVEMLVMIFRQWMIIHAEAPSGPDSVSCPPDCCCCCHNRTAVVPWYLKTFRAAALTCRLFADVARVLRGTYADYYVSRQRFRMTAMVSRGCRRTEAMCYYHLLPDLKTLHGPWEVRKKRANGRYGVVERRTYCFGIECGVRLCYDKTTGLLEEEHYYDATGQLVKCVSYSATNVGTAKRRRQR